MSCLYHFTYEKGSLSLLNAVKSEITFLAKFWFSLECFLELNTFALNKGFVDAILIGPSGPMKWYAMKHFTLKTLNTNSQGKVARQIFGNLPCRSPLKNWNIFFHDIMNEGRQWPWFQLCNHLCFWMNDVLIKRGISKAILVGGFESASLQSCTFKSTS